MMAIRRAYAGLAGALFALTTAAAPVNPFADHNGAVPPASEYAGPLFKLSYRYPQALPAPAMPWRAVLGGGALTPRNAAAYAQALKDAIAADMRVLLADYANWDADKRGWYNDPWLGGQREPIHGLMLGMAAVETSLFAKSALARPFSSYIVTYYNRTAAQTIGRVWGTTAMAPAIDSASTQYADGSVTVKLAFTTAGPGEWPAMEGSPSWPAYVATSATTGQLDQSAVQRLHLLQIDVVVKDTQASPKTGWVFTTLVYDKDRPQGRNGVWDQLVPLGAQWGNDPQVNSAANPGAPLAESWINPQAPLFATETLGWGGRLSGPNDHGRNDISFVVDGQRQMLRNAGNSSCLGCHGSSQWDAAKPAVGMQSFLMPLAPSASGAGQPYLNSPAPGSTDWMRWFQNRKGDVPMDAGSVAGDYDLALVFRVLPAWFEATSGKEHALRALDAGGNKVGRQYNGKIRD
ncbi:MAG: hypothetical protein ACJ8LG_24910 [Massilia sp.]